MIITQVSATIEQMKDTKSRLGINKDLKYEAP